MGELSTFKFQLSMFKLVGSDGIACSELVLVGLAMGNSPWKKVVEIDPKTEEIVWSYDSAASEDNKGKRIEVHAFQPLENGNAPL